MDKESLDSRKLIRPMICHLTQFDDNFKQFIKEEEKADFAAFNWKPNVDFFQFGSEAQKTSENIFSFGGGTPAPPQTVKKRQIVTRPRSRSIQRLKRSGLA